MNKYLKLELRKTPIKTYLYAGLGVFILSTALLYLFAYAPQIDPDPDLKIFSGYDNVFALFSILEMTLFSILSSVMYSKLVIEDYKGQNPILLFTYPAKRSTMFLAKIILVVTLCVSLLLISHLLSSLVFYISEKVIHLVGESLSLRELFFYLLKSIPLAFLASSIGAISMGIGFIKKSVPTAIVSTFAISSIISNLTFSAIEKSSSLNLFPFVIVVLIIFVAVILAVVKNINQMEV